ncbi:MAG: hypothetical protein KGV44_12845 [Flavobacteriaceae bacterium]|nr:hypothetical protein [Flavobacteriaceae bacterium]
MRKTSFNLGFWGTLILSLMFYFFNRRENQKFKDDLKKQLEDKGHTVTDVNKPKEPTNKQIIPIEDVEKILDDNKKDKNDNLTEADRVYEDALKRKQDSPFGLYEDLR